MHKLYATTLQQFGKIDALVVNSGIGERISVTHVSEEKFDAMANINYRGAYFTVKYALDYLNPNASIIMIASASAHVTVKNQSVYASTKAALLQMTKNFSFDLAERQIRVNSISPGYIKTPIFTSRLQANPAYLEEKLQYIPLKRIGEPGDIANAALFLASEEATYITGADLCVDGGLTAFFPG